jgi:hypothetical protein
MPKTGQPKWETDLRETLTAAKAALYHEVPSQCWATGPYTGDERDFICPGCAAIAKIDAELNALARKSAEVQALVKAVRRWIAQTSIPATITTYEDRIQARKAVVIALVPFETTDAT